MQVLRERLVASCFLARAIHPIWSTQRVRRPSLEIVPDFNSSTASRRVSTSPSVRFPISFLVSYLDIPWFQVSRVKTMMRGMLRDYCPASASIRPAESNLLHSEAKYVKRAFLAISIIFCVSRLLLAIEYFRGTLDDAQKQLLPDSCASLRSDTAGQTPETCASVCPCGNALHVRGSIPRSLLRYALKPGLSRRQCAQVCHVGSGNNDRGSGLLLCKQKSVICLTRADRLVDFDASWTDSPRKYAQQAFHSDDCRARRRTQRADRSSRGRVLLVTLHAFIQSQVSAAKSVGFNAKVAAQVFVTAYARFTLR